ncbi:LytTR family DNA-binding domain-containing protein [Chitinophaga sp. HK235]|uniref:LytR/AlgR family response regulator transcription factor n=1 Tax=Chitinophaga sp. HK235 TaxID=2952571 RepID=UPI001BABBE65|nr:LytTR family transcriptional regulator DNA-binding domain-containing protein [Chitinophaga sp. HK235]
MRNKTGFPYINPLNLHEISTTSLIPSRKYYIYNMLKQVNQLLNRKYPFEIVRMKPILIISMLISAVVYVYQPFGFSQYQKNKLLGALPFGVVTFLGLLFCNYFLKGTLLKNKQIKWTILWEAGHILSVFLVLAFLNTLVFLYFFEDIHFFRTADTITQLQLLLHVLMLTVAIGIFPVAAVITIRYNRALRNNLNSIIRSDQQLAPPDPTKQLVFPSANTTEQPLHISIQDFLFLEVVKNHIHVYHLVNGSVTTTVIRNTLTTISETIQDATLFRCHRSFLVNLSHIKTASGNSNGYKIILKGYETYPIPVSRTFVPAFQEIIH